MREYEIVIAMQSSLEKRLRSACLKADRRTPFRATCGSKATNAARTSEFPLGTDVQDNPRDLAPVGTVRIGIEQAGDR
jgi:hypothetical protein